MKVPATEHGLDEMGQADVVGIAVDGALQTTDGRIMAGDLFMDGAPVQVTLRSGNRLKPTA